ncbi:MAG: hypothetical protein ACI9MR_002168 [Myxococcota bacterium]|jgi:uncharacterized protein YaiI (UPF0178 family)
MARAPEITIFIDADACPVKAEVYKVAVRYTLDVRVVANQYIQTPAVRYIVAIQVPQGADVADDWIAEKAGPFDLVVTADIPLAARCLEKGSIVIGTKGREFNDDNIGNALASRELGQELREIGIQTGGPAPMSQKDRSRMLESLDRAVLQQQKKMAAFVAAQDNQ